MYKIFVISLENATERQTFIRQQFAQLPLSLDVEFFPAVNGKANPNHPLFAHHNAEKRYKYKGSQTTLGQLGCFASHYLMWQKCVEENQNMIVLEDDALLLDNFTEAVEFLHSSQNTFEFLWLCPSSSPQPKSKHIASHKQLEVRQYYKPWAGTYAYYLTPTSAQKFLKAHQEWIFDVDISMYRYWENNVPFYALSPACVGHQGEFESQIPVNKGNRPLGVKIRREYYALKDSLKKHYFDWKHR